MKKSTILFEQHNRRYYVVEYRDGFFRACFQPINKKTGKPWQAVRHIGLGNVWEIRDENVIENYQHKLLRTVVQDTCPAIEFNERACRTGEYDTFERARAAALEHAQA